ncbi:MAG: rhodanese-related sulfurtransferase [Rickettsiales bacterium]|nr:rhodanese-related sulfurtransferase [Pseudomonadota bacterium]MDA0965743.1 rhodanese-related sulfurtransferase [Pseudomonadota bacterium]MDG4543795.1 rhodanese-related sulfurtransferase [Rickettsiales bacterium]MDG4545942.1 rhodanese-related sulfurtransferase [Rickettsiales bacterium]MDG4548188.1 rhodanese-related sulfurtransferase [Rickettsiales bacterium]
MSQYVVSAMYHFATLTDFEDLKEPLLRAMKDNNVKGSLLLAREGINGTVASTEQGIKALHRYIKSDPRLAAIVTKESYADKIPFARAKVRLKKEIVTMGVEDIDPQHIVGTYVKPKDWNALIGNPDVVTIDTRNKYETAIGTFKNAVDPQTDTFRRFPKYAQDNLDKFKGKKVAMFCTGGIRCEKSTAYLKQLGVKDVYHLEGGILKYLEEVDEDESLWEGECFVFDSRVAVKHGLAQGQYDQCFACRMPITQEDKQHEYYTQGVSCHHCYDEKSDEQRKRYAQRQKQIAIAKEYGEEHIGGEMASLIAKRRLIKKQKKQERYAN